MRFGRAAGRAHSFAREKSVYPHVIGGDADYLIEGRGKRVHVPFLEGTLYPPGYIHLPRGPGIGVCEGPCEDLPDLVVGDPHAYAVPMPAVYREVARHEEVSIDRHGIQLRLRREFLHAEIAENAHVDGDGLIRDERNLHSHF